MSEHCVRIRLFKLSLWAFDFHAGLLKNLPITEAICMDGLENFAGSQYDPNYINQAVGRDSLFIYDFNFSPLNRKGRMSEWQKGTLKFIVKEKGRYNPRAIRVATNDLLRRLCKKVPQGVPLTILSDEHFQYRRSIKWDLCKLKIEHLTVSSKACRNYQNILFPVNHADLLVRERMAAFSRETISFSKTHARMCQRFMLFALNKNYMRPLFTKKLITRPLAHQKSPAQMLGLTEKLLTYSDIFSTKARTQNINQAKSHEDWRYFQMGKIPPKYERIKKHA